MRVLDSDHCVEVLRLRLDPTAHLAADEELALTAPSVGELTHGAVKSRDAAANLSRLDVLLANLLVLPFDESSARRFGHIKAQLEQAGQVIGDLDLQIASIVLERDGVLVTHNRRHFARLASMTGLALEDWLA